MILFPDPFFFTIKPTFVCCSFSVVTIYYSSSLLVTFRSVPVSSFVLVSLLRERGGIRTRFIEAVSTFLQLQAGADAAGGSVFLRLIQ